MEPRTDAASTQNWQKATEGKLVIPHIQNYVATMLMGGTLPRRDRIDACEEGSDTWPQERQRAGVAATDELFGITVLNRLPEPAYRLRRPLLLILYRSPDHFWVAPDSFVLHGVGETPAAAVEDYGYALLDYYGDLREQREVLAPHLTEHLEFMEDLIVEV